MKRLLALLVLAFGTPAFGQDLMSRIATLEQNNAAILSRMASVESKVDSVASKVDALASKIDKLGAVGAAVVEPQAKAPAVTTLMAPLTQTACDPRTGANCGGSTFAVAYTADGQVYYTQTATACSQGASASGGCGSSANGIGSGHWTPVRNILGRIFGRR